MKNDDFEAKLLNLSFDWDAAFRSFSGAFNTPVDRLKDQSEFAIDCRQRLGAFHSRFMSLKGVDSSNDVRFEGLSDDWKDAYKSFRGIFDTPVARRKINNDYAADARKRLRDFNEMFTEMFGEGSPDECAGVSWAFG